MTGIMDEIMIFNRSLTNAEINLILPMNNNCSAIVSAANYVSPISGLVNYWPLNSHLCDLIGGSHMFGGLSVTYDTDRFGIANSVVSLTSSFLQIPSGIYFSGDFTASIWFYFSTSATQSGALFDFW